MDQARWDRIATLFLDAVERPTALRAGFLDEVCTDDAELRAEVAAMLDAHAGDRPHRDVLARERQRPRGRPDAQRLVQGQGAGLGVDQDVRRDEGADLHLQRPGPPS